jgi:hypothetical protein
VAIAALLLAHWFDAGVVADAQVRAGSTYDTGSLMNALVLARLLTAAGVVAVAAAGWRARTNVVGIGYAIVGGFVATLPATVWAFAANVNGRPPILPDAIARPMTDWWLSLEAGVTGAVYTIAAVMLIVGLAVLGSNLTKKRAQTAPASAPTSEPQPSPQSPLT